MKYESNIRKLYALRFFYSLIPAYVIERLFWEQRGMTIPMVVYTKIIFAVTVVLLEVPTGILADKWGRKKLIVISSFLECIMFLILVFANEFWHFATAVFLAGVARAASSGSENALLYDSLLQNEQEKAFEKYFGRLNVFDFIAAIIAAFCGSFLAGYYEMELNYWLSFVSMLLAVIVSLLLVEPDVADKSDESIPIKDYVKTSICFFRRHTDVSLVVLSGMVTGAALSFIDEFWQLYLNRLEVPIFFFGLFSAVIMIVRLPGNIVAYVLKKHFPYRTILLVVTAMFAVLFLYISVIPNYSAMAAIAFICLFSGVMEPLTTGYLHHRIKSSMRATIDSFQSLLLNAVLIMIGLGFGYFSSKYDVFGGYGFIALICAGFFLYFLLASKRTIFE